MATVYDVLTLSNQQILYKYQKAKQTKDPSDDKPAEEAVLTRINHLMQNYFKTGGEEAKKQSYYLIQGARQIGISFVKIRAAAVLGNLEANFPGSMKVYKKLTEPSQKQLIKALIERKDSKKIELQDYQSLTNELKEIYRKNFTTATAETFRATGEILLVLGYPKKELFIWQEACAAERTLPFLNFGDCQLMAKLDFASATKDKRKILPLKKELFKRYKQIYRNFLRSPLGSPQRKILLDNLYYFGSHFPKMERKLLSDSLLHTKNTPANRTSLITLEDIHQKKEVEIAVDSLPNELKDIFKEVKMKSKYSYFQYLQDNAQWIVFRPEALPYKINYKVLLSAQRGDIGGTFEPVSRTVIIDTVNEDSGERKNKNSLGIVSITIHETAHIEWARKYKDNPLLLRLLPSERYAYLKELEFLQKGQESKAKGFKSFDKHLRMEAGIKRTKVSIFGREIPIFYPFVEIGIQYYEDAKIKFIETLIHATNKALGYPEDDFSYRTDISEKIPQEVLDLYPTKLLEKK